jgi:DNA-directed RNA polymerase specialized sigma subunit
MRKAMEKIDAMKEVRAVLDSAWFRTLVREIVRDEVIDELRDQGKSPDSLTFEIRFLRRELEALTKQLANAQEDNE